MHPAYSIIFFTTASGAGYGLLAWLGVLQGLRMLPADATLGAWSTAAGLLLVTAGLISSTAHLGRPERSWRALSQWRSSWLSREAVLAVLTYGPCIAFAGSWVVWPASGGMAPTAWLMAIGSIATVACTGMIYQSLTTIRAWHQPLVAPLYVALAIASGGVLLLALLRAFGHAPGGGVAIAVGVLLLLALALKRAYWSAIDADAGAHTAGAATGLGRFGAVRPLDPPHTQANFVMREMGYRVARRHALKLRRIAMLLAFALPAALTFLSILLSPAAAMACAALAFASTAAGLVVERWLFFGEAQHVVTLYYGAQRA
jgi:sulfite dehydrogenase (quinone) subunit SoeC